MKDYLFFPLAAIIAAGLIAFAALPGRDRQACGSVSGAGTSYAIIELTAADMCRLEAAGQARLNLLGLEGAPTAMRISAGAGMLGDRPDRNPHFRLAADLEQAFSGFRVRTTIEARPADEGGALALEANYSEGAKGNSGWQRFDLKPGWNTYSFEWDVPARTRTEDQGVDYLALRPYVPEKTRAVDVRAVTFERVALSGN